MITLVRVVTPKILKRYCSNTFDAQTIWRKQGGNFTSPVALIFSPEWDVLLFEFVPALIFWSHLLSKWSGAAMNNTTRKIVALLSCKMDFFYHYPGKIQVKDFIFNKFINFFVCRKPTPILSKSFNDFDDFRYILPKSCLKEQPWMPSSE